MIKLLLVDHQDSFVYNLVELLRSYPQISLDVKSERSLTVEEVSCYSGIILSPGPGNVKDHPFSFDLIKYYEGVKPILGICLGHQLIAACYGAKLRLLDQPYHGKQGVVNIANKGQFFSKLDSFFQVGLYHSWAVDDEGFPHDSLFIRARERKEGTIQAIEHKKWPIFGIQFHPESILTPQGEAVVESFLNIVTEHDKVN